MAKKNISSFKCFNDEQSTRYLANVYPDGKLWSKKYNSDSNIYKMLTACSTFLRIVTGQVFDLAKNIDINNADKLLQEWEESVEIGTKYIRLDTIEERREAIKRKISKVAVFNLQDKDRVVDVYTTVEEYVRIMTGFDIEIETANERGSTSSFPIPFPIKFGIPIGQRSFLWYVKVPVAGQAKNNEFPLEFPVNFFEPSVPDATKKILDIVLNDVVPSFCTWIYESMTI